jgi:hypothetical protein
MSIVDSDAARANKSAGAMIVASFASRSAIACAVDAEAPPSRARDPRMAQVEIIGNG